MSDMSLEQLLAELGTEDAPVEFDWNAPEAGQFAPAVTPGTYDFIFNLRTEAAVSGFDKVEIGGHKYLQAIFDLDVLVPGAEPKKVTYQRANTYKHEKVAISSMGELLRGLGLHRELPDRPTDADIVRVLQAASGRARGTGEAVWRYYCKTHQLTISTQPRKRKGVKDTAWPQQADGSFEPSVQCPKCGANSPKSYGQVEFVRYFTKKDAASAAS